MQLHQVLAGYYWTDAGAFMGVLPYFIWQDKVELDERHRLKMHLNLLLIQTEGKNILVDTGVGNRLNKRRKEIYNPSDFILPAGLTQLGLSPSDVTDVIMTHLHFDHAGGIISEQEGTDFLTFPKAVFHIQSKEWQMAKQPDKLNQAAYQFEHQLALLSIYWMATQKLKKMCLSIGWAVTAWAARLLKLSKTANHLSMPVILFQPVTIYLQQSPQATTFHAPIPLKPN
jgi:hypothetical protein